MKLLHPCIFVSLSIITIVVNQIQTSFCAEDEKFINCSIAFDCANLKHLPYPFWGSNRPRYCGHPAFELKCSEKIAEITIMSESYEVLEVSDSSHSLKIVRNDYPSSACPTHLMNNTIDCIHFNYSPDSKNLTLLYDCPSPTYSYSLPYGLYNQFNCSINGTEMVNYFFLGNLDTSGSFSESIDTCKSKVILPILESEARNIETNPTPENLKAALSSGFGLEWKANNSLCDNCQHSGGHCGSDSTSLEFTCYCKKGSFPYTCGSGKRKNINIIIIGTTVGAAAGLVCILLGCWLCFAARRRKRMAAESKSKDLFMPPPIRSGATSTTTSQSVPSYHSSSVQRSSYFGVQVFSYTELEEATNKFDISRELGDGGFGTVYYGILKDGRPVAVKRLYESNLKRVEQFMNEVEILARLRHENLVALYGCTSRHSRELLLVYEYISNGTVADHIHGNRASSSLLPWPVRLKIAVETAQALAYLHSSDVIHRDVKTNNILLDKKFRVKVADFGLSRLFPNDVSHVSTAPQGTPGYVDPEYYHCYQLTDKSDVYSFGVVLAELISSVPAVDTNRHRHDVNLANMAVSRIQNHALKDLVDPALGFERDRNVRQTITSVAELAFRCLQRERDTRPSMEEVVNVLREIQNQDFGVQGAEVLDIREDDITLLKNVLDSPLSPNSVADKWVSSSTASNSS